MKIVNNKTLDTLWIEKTIANLLNKLNYCFYNEEVPNTDSDVYPRCVYNLDYISLDALKTLVELEINIWAMDSNYMQVNEIADKISNELNNEILFKDKAVKVFQQINIKVEDEDHSIKRRRLLFSLEIY